MKLHVKAAVVAAATVAVVAAMTGTGAAVEAPLPTDVLVSFDKAAPKTGAAVSSVVTVKGSAEALDGVRTIELHVVADRPTGRPVTGRPLATAVFEVPRTPAPFTFQWDPGTRARTVDVVVVARTATRAGQAEISGVRIVAPAPAPAPKPAPQPAPQAEAAGAPAAQQVPGAAAAAPAVAAPVAGKPAPKPAPQRPAEPEVSADQARAFYEEFGQLRFGAEEEAVVEVPATVERAAGAELPTRPLPWLAIGFGLLLMAAAVQMLRLARPREAWAVNPAA